ACTFSCIAECSSALSRPHLLFLSPPSVPARTPSKALALACSLPNVLPSAPPFRCILTASKEDISIGLRRGHFYWGATNAQILGSSGVGRIAQAFGPMRAPSDVVAEGQSEQNEQPEQGTSDDQVGQFRAPPDVHKEQSDERGLGSRYRHSNHEVEYAKVDERDPISDNREQYQGRKYNGVCLH